MSKNIGLKNTVKAEAMEDNTPETMKIQDESQQKRTSQVSFYEEDPKDQGE